MIARYKFLSVNDFNKNIAKSEVAQGQKRGDSSPIFIIIKLVSVSS